MKRPKCMEKRILDDVPVVNICPKCGSEMFPAYELSQETLACSNCGQEKVT
jgi:predicted RNA-binding Zn-ribbon protein involved in translation (DUF1610 family)